MFPIAFYICFRCYVKIYLLIFSLINSAVRPNWEIDKKVDCINFMKKKARIHYSISKTPFPIKFSKSLKPESALSGC